MKGRYVLYAARGVSLKITMYFFSIQWLWARFEKQATGSWKRTISRFYLIYALLTISSRISNSVVPSADTMDTFAFDAVRKLVETEAHYYWRCSALVVAPLELKKICTDLSRSFTSLLFYNAVFLQPYVEDACAGRNAALIAFGIWFISQRRLIFFRSKAILAEESNIVSLTRKILKNRGTHFAAKPFFMNYTLIHSFWVYTTKICYFQGRFLPCKGQSMQELV